MRVLVRCGAGGARASRDIVLPRPGQVGIEIQGGYGALLKSGDRVVETRVTQLQTFDKLGRVDVAEASAGDVVAVVGLGDVEIGDTISDFEQRRSLPRLTVDEPTLEMVFTINSSPFAGREGKYVTTRQLRDRLDRELERNVALRVRPMEGSEAFAVSGRGVLHLAVRR